VRRLFLQIAGGKKCLVNYYLFVYFMKIFLDSADVDAIKDLASSGLIDGVTTNPSLIAKSGKRLEFVIEDICKVVEGPVSAEVISLDLDGMLKEADKLSKIAPNVCIKLPITLDGLRASKILSDKGIATNVTLCFSVSQALLVAKTGAAFVSPFLGRWDDIGVDGLGLIEEIRGVFDNFGFETEILGASIRHPLHFLECAKIGVDVVTIPPSLFEKLYKHPLTDKGIEIFLTDYEKSKPA
jgi:transaldolase